MLAPVLAAQEPPNDLSQENSDSSVWLSGETKYEGFPLLLRRPKDVDHEALPPKLIVVTHLLDKTKPNGLPEPDYNDTLFDFDGDVIDTFRTLKSTVVLIETFGHKRSYYAYCPESVTLAEVQGRLTKGYPGYRLEWFERSDPTARFIKKYAKEHF
jgi:hypothetical protein